VSCVAKNLKLAIGVKGGGCRLFGKNRPILTFHILSDFDMFFGQIGGVDYEYEVGFSVGRRLRA